jgi:hypothetical protein
MKLGNYDQLKAALLPHYGDVYTDDNEVVRLDDPDARTVAYLSSTQPGYLVVTPKDGSSVFAIKVDGAGPEPHEIPPTDSKH